MYRIAILKKDGKVIGKNFAKRPEAQDFILDIATKEGVKKAYILDKTTGKREKVEGLE